MDKHRDSTTRISIIAEHRGAGSLDFHGLFTGWQFEYLKGKILRAGLRLADITFYDSNKLSSLPESEFIVTMGEGPLRKWTDKKSIDKWNLSPLKIGNAVLVPTYCMGRVQKEYELGFFQELAFRRIAEFMVSFLQRPPERFFLNPPLAETIEILHAIKDEEELAVDVETGYGQINTVGFAWSPQDAIAIQVLPDRCGDDRYFELWQKISEVLAGPSRKIYQNFIYDTSYFSAYGCPTNNIYFDTMWAQRVLYPEFKVNLGMVGRIFTHRTYWKDDGKETDGEGAKKDWGNIRDWPKHFLYNCRDTSGTLEASRYQRQDLSARGLDEFFFGYVMKLHMPILEMCSRGMPVSQSVRERLSAEVSTEIEQLRKEFGGIVGDLNPNSPKQLLAYFRDQKLKPFRKFDKKIGSYKDSADSASVKKMRLKYPERRELDLLLQIKKKNKAFSSYIDFKLRPDGRASYSLNGCGTETLRWSGGKDPWDRGFNIQTIPREGTGVSIKQMFVAPGGMSFLEVDLRQAESRFVAYDAPDHNLIQMLENGDDVHRYVASEIFGKRQNDITKGERQLGKKSGHGANYAMKEGVFVDTCFNEMNLVLSRKEATKTLEAYHTLFPGIRMWHAGIERTLRMKRKLTAPSGWERYFYGRLGPDMFKEAYAWRPQHTIPWITNHLLMHLVRRRAEGALSFELISQTHDSLYLLVPDARLNDVAQVCLQHREWHPKISLPGGSLWIPTEVKTGKSMDKLEEFNI